MIRQLLLCLLGFQLFFLVGVGFADQSELATVTVQFSSQPADASIFIKHEKWERRKLFGKTPKKNFQIPKGKVEVILLKEDYLPLVEIIDSSQKSSFNFTLFKNSSSTYQLNKIPDFVTSEQEGFKIYKKILQVLMTFYVDEQKLDRLVEASIRRLVASLNAVRIRRKTIEKAYPDPSKRAKFYDTFDLKPDIDTSAYDSLGYYIKRTPKRVEIFLNTRGQSIFLEIDPEKEQTALYALIGVLDFLKRSYDYKNKLDWDILYYIVIQGMIESLDDEHTSFLLPKHWERTKEETRASFGGIGIQVFPNKKEGFLEIISPISDTPAARAGLLPKDRIVEVEDLDVASLDDPQQAIDYIRGEPGSLVRLTIERFLKDSKEVKRFEVSLKRDIIKLVYIKEEMLEDKIGYIRITSFMDEKLIEKFVEKFNKLREDGCVGLIIDLRNNPGGLLVNAIKMADLFISKGIILETRGRIKNKDQKAEASSKGTYPEDIPLVILVNEGSASASEIVSGALKDYGRAVLVGKKTFGKGSVLELYPFAISNNKKVGLAFTISKYFLPKGECIHKIGLLPNFEVDVPDEVKEKIIGRSIYTTKPRDFVDPQLHKGIEIIKEKVKSK